MFHLQLEILDLLCELSVFVFGPCESGIAGLQLLLDVLLSLLQHVEQLDRFLVLGLFLAHLDLLMLKSLLNVPQPRLGLNPRLLFGLQPPLHPLQLGLLHPHESFGLLGHFLEILFLAFFVGGPPGLHLLDHLMELHLAGLVALNKRLQLLSMLLLPHQVLVLRRG